MCGFVGYFALDKINASITLKNSVKLLRHRGPDDSGQLISKNIGLGSTRLSIQDLSSRSRMPMESKNKRYVIVFNGEIYNFKELREEILKKGIELTTTSDTEVLLTMYQLYREKSLNYLNGMFSFAILDKKNKSIFLARDRFGIKPLLFLQIKSTYSFCFRN